LRVFRKIALLGAALAVAGLGQVTQIAPAQAVDTCVVVAAPANVSNSESPKGGLYYPATDPTPDLDGDFFTWNLNGTCANNGVPFTSSGTGVGWCGRSVGTGTGSAGGVDYTISWQSLGSQLVLVDPSALGSVNAQPNPPGSNNGSCLDGSAKTFLVDGAIVIDTL
jgi:hypothetical protein